MFPVITVEGVPTVNRVLDVLEKAKEQLPFAISLALNWTGDEVVKHSKEKLFREKFTIRNQWMEKGPFRIKRTSATKANLETIVGSEAPFLKGHESGATRKARGSFRMIPDPSIRQTQKSLVKKKERPGALIQKKEAFFLPSKAGPVLFTRLGPGARNLKAWFFGRPRVEIKPRLPFVETEAETVHRVYPQIFGKALSFALATKKEK